MKKSYAEYALLFDILSDPTRLQILDMLSCGSLCACHLLEAFHITQPTLSHHMKKLVACGLVCSAKEGIWVKYWLNTEKSEELSAYITELTHPKETCICNVGEC